MCFEFWTECDRDYELQMSGGRKFQSRGPWQKRNYQPRDVQTYELDRTDESDDIVESDRKWDRDGIEDL